MFGFMICVGCAPHMLSTDTLIHKHGLKGIDLELIQELSTSSVI